MGDELPRGRKKIIHSVGVVGRVEWRDLGGHPFTGIFRGARHGIARFSHALRYARREASSLCRAVSTG